MHIFIDESGTFSGIGKRNSISLVGALVIPDHRMAKVILKYSKLRPSLPMHNGEVKGRLLGEHHYENIISILQRNEVIFEVVMMDGGMHVEADILAHKRSQEDAITQHLTEAHTAEIHSLLWGHRQELEAMPPPLYCQSVLTVRLLRLALETGTLYHCQRHPKELGAFHWVFDAKDLLPGLTPWERWFSFGVLPQLESQSMKEPAGRIEWGDYSYFDRFKLVGGISAYKRQFLAHPIDERIPPVDIKMIMTEDMRFLSASHPGLELVDIVTNGVRRALKGNLRKKAWGLIPSLMIDRKNGGVEVVVLTNTPDQSGITYKDELRAFRGGGRSMCAPRFIEKIYMR
ncbi:hypothetical protein BA190_24065 [Labrys sp. WJW]|uniref:hypothetical protein n=1 Tax=Labrys sp. WJW TaxID=1737983 RepID=UPI0008369DE8|nr:hypothetical protein [Labrys sp. WJW]OCC02403.1 hypothetical protein BA190_24065 [Labrys sp. WJW]